MWTKKQKDYINNATKRWNIKVGATGTGKTYVDFMFIIPYRTRQLQALHGINLLIGVTTSTVERNVLRPMRDVYGEGLVGNIVKGEGTVQLFGETYYVIGAEKENAVNKIQGATVKYVYGDEFVNWNETFFKMLTTRLRVEGATADLTGNPQTPTHWAKKFIDKMLEEGSLYYQTSTIYDNPTLPKEFVEAQEIELKGTAEYQRLILGQWAVAEGAIYPMFNQDNILSLKEWEEVKQSVMYVQIGVDIGGNKSKTSFQATAVTQGLKEIITFKERRFDIEEDIEKINQEFKQFILSIRGELPHVKIRVVYIDNAEQIIIRSMRAFARQDGYINHSLLRDARKLPILDRIRTYQALLNLNRYKVLETCTITQDAFRNAMWSGKADKDGKEKRLDDGTTNIDTLDAQEYSTEDLHKVLIGKKV